MDLAGIRVEVGGNDGRIVEEERCFRGEVEERGKEDLPMGSTWRLISRLMV